MVNKNKGLYVFFGFFRALVLLSAHIKRFNGLLYAGFIFLSKFYSEILCAWHFNTIKDLLPAFEDNDTLKWNPTIFHNDHIPQGLWTIVRTTFQYIVVQQLREEGPEKYDICGTDLSHSCPTFQKLLAAIGEQRYIEM